jgi:hypothetical protein
MYFVGSLEKSETGTYKIGGFSFEPAQTETVDEVTDEGAATDAETPVEPEAAETAANPHPLFDWIITVYLLYYG